jgi:hypothetical protein
MGNYLTLASQGSMSSPRTAGFGWLRRARHPASGVPRLPSAAQTA